jgi:hypothetical protein
MCLIRGVGGMSIGSTAPLPYSKADTTDRCAPT